MPPTKKRPSARAPRLLIQLVVFTQLQEEALVELAMQARRRAISDQSNGSRSRAGRSRPCDRPESAGASEPGDRRRGPPTRRAPQARRGAECRDRQAPTLRHNITAIIVVVIVVIVVLVVVVVIVATVIVVVNKKTASVPSTEAVLLLLIICLSVPGRMLPYCVKQRSYFSSSVCIPSSVALRTFSIRAMSGCTSFPAQLSMYSSRLISPRSNASGIVYGSSLLKLLRS